MSGRRPHAIGALSLKVASVALAGVLAFASGVLALTLHHPSVAATAHDDHESRQITISVSGGGGADGTDLTLGQLLPGSPATVTLDYSNTGQLPAVLYLAFPNRTALSALNTLGRYGLVRISSAGAGALGSVFSSSDLSDACASPSPSSCWPLKGPYPLTGVLAPGQSGSVSFEFEFASAYATQPASGQSGWNPYPVAGQAVVIGSDGHGSGLPYQLVAVGPSQEVHGHGRVEQREPFGESLSGGDAEGHCASHLQVDPSAGTVQYSVTQPNRFLSVTTDGTVSCDGSRLAPGRYTIGGTDTDSQGDIGTWSFTVVVSPHRGH